MTERTAPGGIARPDTAASAGSSITLLTRFLFAALLVAASIQVSFACSRDDVEYYLDKGFSREQITAICQAGDPPARQGSRYEAYTDPAERGTRQEQRQRQEEEEIRFLENSLKAKDVRLTPRRIEYTRRFCLTAGKTPEVQGRTRVCPDVRYHVYFKGLEVGDYQRKYFFLGNRELQVIGTVKRKMLNNLSGYPSDIRQGLLAAYRSAIRQGGTAIPVRRDAPINRVASILRKYARRASEPSSRSRP